MKRNGWQSDYTEAEIEALVAETALTLPEKPALVRPPKSAPRAVKQGRGVRLPRKGRR